MKQTETIETIINKLKNKQDLNLAHIETKKTNIYIQLNHIYFDTHNSYTITIIKNKKQQKQILWNLSKAEAIKKLSKIKIISYHI